MIWDFSQAFKPTPEKNSAGGLRMSRSWHNSRPVNLLVLFCWSSYVYVLKADDQRWVTSFTLVIHTTSNSRRYAGDCYKPELLNCVSRLSVPLNLTRSTRSWFLLRIKNAFPRSGMWGTSVCSLGDWGCARSQNSWTCGGSSFGTSEMLALETLTRSNSVGLFLFVLWSGATQFILVKDILIF